MNKKILVLGSTGLLGSVLLRHFSKDFEVIGHSYTNKEADIVFDINNTNKLKEALESIQPDILLNCIAMTNVDHCEIFKEKATILNEKVLIDICKFKKKSTWVVHFSTDHVYDIDQLNKEEDHRLSNHYSLTKFNSEKYVLDSGGLVLRTNFFGHSYNHIKKTFNEWLDHQKKAQNKFKIIKDVYFSPISLESLCLKLDIIFKKYFYLNSLFNLGSSTFMSKKDFAFYIFDIIGYPIKGYFNLVNANDLFQTYRPKFMQMDISKITKIIGEMPSLEDEIKRCYEKY